MCLPFCPDGRLHSMFMCVFHAFHAGPLRRCVCHGQYLMYTLFMRHNNQVFLDSYSFGMAAALPRVSVPFPWRISLSISATFTWIYSFSPCCFSGKGPECACPAYKICTTNTPNFWKKEVLRHDRVQSSDYPPNLPQGSFMKRFDLKVASLSHLCLMFFCKAVRNTVGPRWYGLFIRLFVFIRILPY